MSEIKGKISSLTGRKENLIIIIFVITLTREAVKNGVLTEKFHFSILAPFLV